MRRTVTVLMVLTLVLGIGRPAWGQGELARRARAERFAGVVLATLGVLAIPATVWVASQVCWSRCGEDAGYLRAAQLTVVGLGAAASVGGVVGGVTLWRRGAADERWARELGLPLTVASPTLTPVPGGVVAGVRLAAF
jgi:hypothetical protein